MRVQETQAGRDAIIVLGTFNQNVAAPATQTSSRHQLPPEPPAFTGREDDVRELLQRLESGHAAGATIWQGMGGVGKSALAIVLAHRLRERFPDAQLYRDLRGADEESRTPLQPAEVMRALIVELQPATGRLPDDADALQPLYWAALRQAGRVLLLLDNAAGAAQVEPLLPPENCLLLVTSRQHFAVDGLVERNLDCLPPGHDTRLLLALAPRLEGHAEEAARLCGGLPLALKVVARAVQTDRAITPVPVLLDRLRKREETLGKVDAAFAVSESLLPEETRAAWHVLAVFTASFDLPAAAAIWEKPAAAAEALMQALVNASLVEHNPKIARFRLHDLARQYCQARLAPAAEEPARLRHAAHFVKLGYETTRLYLAGGAHVVEGLALFERERPHLEAAFGWLAGRADQRSAELLVALVNEVAYVSELRFHPTQRIAWLEAQRTAAQRAGDRRAEGNALGNLGSAFAALGDARKAIELYEQRLVIARGIGDRRGEGNALGNLGTAYAVLGDARKAIELYEERLVIAREIGDRRGEGNALGSLGNAYAGLGDARKAIEFYQQCLAIHREIGDRRGEGNDSFNLATELWPLGERKRALEAMAAAAEIYAAIEDPHAKVAEELLAQWRAEAGAAAD